nr:hypothetical protein [Candidatus Sigynarchaeota archaeon]
MSKEAIEEINHVSQVAIPAAAFISVTLVLIMQLNPVISLAIILPVLVFGIVVRAIMARKARMAQSPCQDNDPVISCSY